MPAWRLSVGIISFNTFNKIFNSVDFESSIWKEHACYYKCREVKKCNSIIYEIKLKCAVQLELVPQDDQGSP